MYVPALHDLALDPDLAGAPARVYLYLLHHLDPLEFRPVKAWGLARSLTMKRETAGSALRLLVAKGYLAQQHQASFPSNNVHLYRIHYTRHDPAAVAPSATATP